MISSFFFFFFFAPAGAAVVNLIPGAGQVAYGGAIAGAAIGHSVVDAVGQLWDWFWG